MPGRERRAQDPVFPGAPRPGVALAVLLVLVLASRTGAQPGWSWHDRLFGKSWSFTPSRDEILVVFSEAASEGERLAATANEPLAVRHDFDPATRTAVYRITSDVPAAALAPRLAASAAIEHAVPAAVGAEGVRYFVPDRVTVRFEEGLDDAACRAAIASAGAGVLRDYWTPGYYLVTIPPGHDPFRAVRDWYEVPGVRFSEPLWLVYDDLQHIPDDPLFPDQWHLRNVGQNGWTPGADVMAPEAWDVETGDATVLIVVIDTGIEQTHDDLAPNLIPQNGDDWNFEDPEDDSAEDWHGHGTNCAGIAVGVQDNGVGVSGIAPGCAIMPLRIDANPGHNANRADAINYAASRRGEFDGLVMSCSWGLTAGDFIAVQDAVENAHADDCVLVFAGGNADELGIDFPARYPETIAVTASSPCDERKTPASCDGVNDWGASFGPELDVVAPGVFITTTDMAGNPGQDCGKNQVCGGLADGSYNSEFEGASAAAPLVAGICGLLYSVNPCLSNEDVREILHRTAEDEVGDPNEDVEGFDIYMGWGRVNAYYAVEMARGWGRGPQIGAAADGRCLAWADADDDGDLDVYVGNDGPNRLLSNDGNGTFTDVTSGPLADAGAAVSAAWADWDNDQDEDLYVVNAGSADRLLRNDGAGDFAVVVGGPLGDAGEGRAVAWADWNGDGHVDFYLVKWQEPDRLYRNDGDGTFSDVTAFPLGDAGAGASCSWADPDDDGDLDLYLLRGAGQANILYRNDGGGAFADVTSGPLGDPGHGTAGAWGDYDEDGDPDLYVANLGSPNRLLRNDGGGDFADVTAGPEGVSTESRSAAWGDYDNDGDLDLYVVDGSGPNLLLRGAGGSFFEAAEGPLVGDDGAGRAAAWVDYDGDGDLDLHVVNANGTDRMIRNWRQELPGPLPSCSAVNHWLEFDLQGNGNPVPPIGSNLSAVGTRLRVFSSGGVQARWVTSGAGSAQPPRRAHFGLGRDATVDSLEIRWPSGLVQVFPDLPVDSRFSILEGMTIGALADVTGEGTGVRLLPNEPNPFRANTRIPFVTAVGADVRLEIYDAAGRRVRTLVSGYRPAGRHAPVWDGRADDGAPLPSGVYFARMTAGETVSTRKLVVLR